MRTRTLLSQFLRVFLPTLSTFTIKSLQNNSSNAIGKLNLMKI